MLKKHQEDRLYTEVLIALAVEYYQTGDFMAGKIADYADMFCVSHSAARRVLNKLIRHGMIEKIKIDGVIHYHLARSWIEYP